MSALSRTTLPDLEATITSDFWMDPTIFETIIAPGMAQGFDSADFSPIGVV